MPHWLVDVLYSRSRTSGTSTSRTGWPTATPSRAGTLAWVTVYALVYVALVLALGLARLPVARLPVTNRIALPLAARPRARHAREPARHRRAAGRLPGPGGGALPLVGPAGEDACFPASRASSPTSTGCAPSSTSAASGSSRTTRASSSCEPLIEITTTLDPRLEIAYRYGAIFLSEPAPSAPVARSEGIEVLETGHGEPARSWRLRQDLGFFTHLFLHDSARAARILHEASQVPGAPYWLRDAGRRPSRQGRRPPRRASHVAADVRPGRARGDQGERPREPEGARRGRSGGRDAGRGGRFTRTTRDGSRGAWPR